LIAFLNRVFKGYSILASEFPILALYKAHVYFKYLMELGGEAYFRSFHVTTIP
jgi:hypothetical protein